MSVGEGIECARHNGSRLGMKVIWVAVMIYLDWVEIWLFWLKNWEFLGVEWKVWEFLGQIEGQLKESGENCLDMEVYGIIFKRKILS